MLADLIVLNHYVIQITRWNIATFVCGLKSHVKFVRSVLSMERMIA